jgi:membrane protein involved in colicin uptake
LSPIRAGDRLGELRKAAVNAAVPGAPVVEDHDPLETAEWVADKKKRAEKIRAAKAELEAEAKTAAAAKAKAQAEAEERRRAEGRSGAPSRD